MQMAALLIFNPDVTEAEAKAELRKLDQTLLQLPNRRDGETDWLVHPFDETKTMRPVMKFEGIPR